MVEVLLPTVEARLRPVVARLPLPEHPGLLKMQQAEQPMAAAARRLLVQAQAALVAQVRAGAQVRAAALQPVVQTLEPQVVLPIAAPRVRAVVQAQVQADPAPQPVAQRVAQEAVPRAVQAAQAPLLRPVLAVRVVRLPAAQVARVQ